MGKYMRKRSVGRTPAVELGVRTRARSAAVANAAAAGAAAEAPAPKRPRKQATARAEAEAEAAVRGNGGGASPGCCYLQLRSRRLFMSAGDVQCPVPPLPAVAVQRSVPSGEPVVEVAGMCSSTASSVDVVLAMAPARETSGGEAEEAHEDCKCDVESVVSDSAGCGRERRETTPSSRPSVDLSDEEWSQATDDDPKRHLGRTALATTATTTAVACRRARMPPTGEIEEFFGAAEKAQAERFAAKYNFDVERGLPLGAGRYEWTPVASG
ncbi:cyclin-dependent kinase inhibitor 1-like [Miscanthus floridulus]|uniref:cyclin-dependent kinase inhibitor 1-like n=1 Tax=Miscanthus floridulus TaxID=154761 RepID=UPI0034588D12